jgi:PAS domain S-box-containing protein
MVPVADSPLTRRDVRRFFTWLVGFLVVLILTLLLFLRHDLSRTEASIDRWQGTVADVAADTINNTPPANLETQLVFVRSRYGVVSAEIVHAGRPSIRSGSAAGNLDAVIRQTRAGTLTLRFNGAERAAAKRRFLFTVIICIAAVSFGTVLLLSFLREDELRRLHEQEKTRADDLERVTAALTRSLTSGLLAVDAAGNIVDINAAGREILRVDAAQPVAGRPIEEAVPLAGFAGAVRHAFEQHAPVSRVEVGDRHTDGDAVTIGLTTAPLRDEAGTFLGFLALFTDLTPIRSLEVRVQEMTTLAQLGEIAAGIAHEFRSSLSTILGYMKLARKGSVDQVAEARLQSAEKEAALLLQAIERLLAFARPVELHAEPVDLRELLEEQVQPLRDTAPDVRFDLSGPSIVIEADRILLSRAFENVLRNAVDAVRQKGENGSIRIRLAEAPAPSVTISDDGIGFDPAETAKLFLPFHSNKPNGFGMGLPLAKKIVLLHGGTLRLQGETGRGAVATIEFAAA